MTTILSNVFQNSGAIFDWLGNSADVRSPDLFLLLGDAVYRDASLPWQAEHAHKFFRRLFADRAFEKFFRHTPLYTMYDGTVCIVLYLLSFLVLSVFFSLLSDHDFLENDYVRGPNSTLMRQNLPVWREAMAGQNPLSSSDAHDCMRKRRTKPFIFSEISSKSFPLFVERSGLFCGRRSEASWYTQWSIG